MIAAFLGVWLSTASGAGATTSTTLPGPAPNQSQIDATQSQVAQIESTLAQEEQQSSILDDKYNTAVQNLQNAQAAAPVDRGEPCARPGGGRGRQTARADGRRCGIRVRHTPDRVRVLLLFVGDPEPGP